MNKTNTENRYVRILSTGVHLEGIFSVPEDAKGLVVFVHGSGSSRNSPRNQYVAQTLQEGGLATLLFDLLTAAEEEIDLQTHHWCARMACSATVQVFKARSIWIKHWSGSGAHCCC